MIFDYFLKIVRKNCLNLDFKTDIENIYTSRKQTTIITSTIEIELHSLLHVDKKLIWWNNMFQKLRFNTEKNLIIWNDNLQIICLLNSKIPRLETRLRHVDISQCWLRQKIQFGHFNVDYISTARMVADGLTKMFFSQKHAVFIQQLGLKDFKQKIMKLNETSKWSYSDWKTVFLIKKSINTAFIKIEKMCDAKCWCI